MAITYGMYHSDAAHGSHGHIRAHSREIMRAEDEARKMFKYHRDRRLDAERRAAVERHRAAGRLGDDEAAELLRQIDSDECTDQLHVQARLSVLDREARREQ